jgi:hypothetical protein
MNSWNCSSIRAALWLLNLLICADANVHKGTGHLMRAVWPWPRGADRAAGLSACHAQLVVDTRNALRR